MKKELRGQHDDDDVNSVVDHFPTPHIQGIHPQTASELTGILIRMD